MLQSDWTKGGAIFFMQVYWTAHPDLANKGEFRSRPITAFVYIFVLNQSGCRKAKIVSKTSEKILPSSRALVQVNFNFFNLKPKYYDRTH